MARTVAVGEQDFGKIIEHDYFYIDKTLFIKEWWENGDTVTLITRPRRFGKTLTMHMLYYFFSVNAAGRSGLFAHLNIWKEEPYRKLQGTYPVIFLSFAAVKAASFEEAYMDICGFIAQEYRKYAFLLKEDGIQMARGQFLRIMDGAVASVSECKAALQVLSEYLYRYYGKKVIILLDEYDTPMQEAYLNGYWDAFTGFISGLFNFTFKTNPYLERALMTGITRVSRESVFSDLNNLAVVTTTTKKYDTMFGFTEEEVIRALDEFGLKEQMDGVKHWYDGFRFGTCASIYNPWSITQFLDEKVLAPYWANTSSNSLVGKLIREAGTEIKAAVEDLLQNKTVCTQMDEQIVFQELDVYDDAAWSFLLASGYLKIVSYHGIDPIYGRGGRYELALTNQEVLVTFRRLVQGWFANQRYGYNSFLKALLAGDLKSMNVYMNKIALATISFFDSAKRPSAQTEPERFYHGFVLGMVVDLAGRYRVLSNRESGLGRYDVLLEPCSRGDDGIILEFKVFDEAEGEKSLKDTARAALRQIIDKKYDTELKARCGLEQIRIYGFAFRGKEVWIDGGCMEEFCETKMKQK
ncbi:MAG: ATP-binding protein [Eubacterium sp.]|nr:ATP-binding protein [Eubacterium sp.]